MKHETEIKTGVKITYEANGDFRYLYLNSAVVGTLEIASRDENGIITLVIFTALNSDKYFDNYAEAYKYAKSYFS